MLSQDARKGSRLAGPDYQGRVLDFEKNQRTQPSAAPLANVSHHKLMVAAAAEKSIKTKSTRKTAVKC